MYKHFEYTEMLARELKAIAHKDDDRHYFRATSQSELQEIETNIRSLHGMIMVAIDGTNSSFHFRESDSLVERPVYGIVIIQQTKSNDTDTIFEAKEACKKAMMQVVARMLNDANRNKHSCQFIEPDSFQLSGEGPVADNFYGVGLSFMLAEGIEYKLNPEMWQ